MKKTIIFLILAAFVFLSQNAFAVGAPDATLAIKLQTLWQKANAVVQNNNAVQTIMTLKKNYDQTKEYYDYFKKLNEYEGGIGAYYRDNLSKTLTDTTNNGIYDLQRAWENPTDAPNYVKETVESMKKKANKRIDALFEYEQQKKTRREVQNKAIERYTQLAGKNKLTTEEKNEMDKTADTIQITTMAAILSELEQMNARAAQEELYKQERIERAAADQKQLEALMESIKESKIKQQEYTKEKSLEIINKGIKYGK